jgi:glucosamine kinase
MVIADSGSTKTTWRIAKNRTEFIDIQTDGINPYFQNEKDIAAIVKEQLLNQIDQNWKSAFNNLFFYGAGCSNPEKINQVKNGLKSGYSNWEILVEHDLLASARSLLADKSGIACILGTGSNSCVFKEGKVTDNIASWGFMFGDYGSGAHIGKQLVQRYANNEFSTELKSELEAKGLNREVILNHVYQQTLPNRYLAKFSKLAGELIHYNEINNLVINCFEIFLKYQVEIYKEHKNYEISFVGSVAHYFSEQLNTALNNKNLRIGTINKEPIQGLFEYHKIT